MRIDLLFELGQLVLSAGVAEPPASKKVHARGGTEVTGTGPLRPIGERRIGGLRHT
jgi:hypothetical protein